MVNLFRRTCTIVASAMSAHIRLARSDDERLAIVSFTDFQKGNVSEHDIGLKGVGKKWLCSFENDGSLRIPCCKKQLSVCRAPRNQKRPEPEIIPVAVSGG